MIRTLMATAAATWLVLAAANPALAQRSLADVLGQAPTLTLAFHYLFF